MKARCINTDNVYPGTLAVGEEYNITERWTGCYVVNDRSVSLSNFETPLQRLTRLAETAVKMVIVHKAKGHSVDLWQTDLFIILYSHSKGSRWNIGGNHSFYAHDINTGEFVASANSFTGKGHIKQKLKVADIANLESVYLTNKVNPYTNKTIKK